MKLFYFSLPRMMAIWQKELIQIKRDKGTFALLLGIPLIQLILFGYVINFNPHNLPTVVINADQSPLTRTLITSLETSGYFEIIDNDANEDKARNLIAKGDATFAINIPANFSHDLIRGERPSLLVTADATDPIASVNALTTLSNVWQHALDLDLQRGLSYLINSPALFNIIVHTAYNPESITQYNIVPGLIGVILTMTMVLITSLAITRERERGTIETLLATPIQPLEIMLGKILPYIFIGYLQELIVLIFALVLFDIPFNGSFILLMIATLPFIIANLTVGLMFSTLAQNQLQATQMTLFFILPSLLMSGFLFPFYGMPEWAQWIGSIFPLTHFLDIVRGIMIKGNGFFEIWSSIGALILFTLAVLLIGFKRFHRTLD